MAMAAIENRASNEAAQRPQTRHDRKAAEKFDCDHDRQQSARYPVRGHIETSSVVVFDLADGGKDEDERQKYAPDEIEDRKPFVIM